MEIKSAVKEDARDLAYLINLAGEGIPKYLWEGMKEGSESSLDVGTRRAARVEGSFSYTNARVCVEKNEILGMMISYRQPDPYIVDDLSEYPEVARPLVKLEAEAPGSWYINAIATYEAYRGKGVAKALMKDAESQALAHECRLLSLIVASENTNAKRLYEYFGYHCVSSLPVVSYPGGLHGGEWLLMTKPFLG